MKKHLTLLLTLISLSTFSQEEIYISKNEGIYSRNANNCPLTFIAPTADNMLDIALTPNGNLYGVTGTEIYQINKVTGAMTLVAPLTGLTTNINSLVAYDNTRLLFVSQFSLYSVNVETQAIALIGVVGYMSLGDLTWYDADLFFSSGSNLIKIVLNDTGTAIVSAAPVNSEPTAACFALMTVSHEDFSDNIILGFTSGGVFEICPIDGSFNLRCSATSNVLGATATRLQNQVPKPEVCPVELSLPDFTENEKLLLSPNPISQNEDLEIKFSHNTNRPVKINVFNVQGMKLFTRDGREGVDFEINLNTIKLSSGIYFVEVSGTDFRYTSRLVVR